MEVKYPIDDHLLMANLDQEYGIRLKTVEFIPMGDSAYSYRLNGVNGERYYLKIFDHRNDKQRRGIAKLNGYLPLICNLYRQKLMRNISYPIRTRQGDFYTSFSGITAVLFNFIDGDTLAEAYPFPKEILVEIAKTAADIHRITPGIESALLPAETFDISFEFDLDPCISALESTAAFDNVSRQALREHVVPMKKRILFLLDLVRELRGQAVSAAKDQVLCHGDLWGGNLIRHGGELHVIDWESAIVAPPEFDLVGYIGEEFDVFFSAYEKHLGRSVTINLDLLRFYAYRHHLRNLANWLMNILYRNTEQAQNENDLDMILYHCMNRWDRIEPNIQATDAVLRTRKSTGNGF